MISRSQFLVSTLIFLSQLDVFLQANKQIPLRTFFDPKISRKDVKISPDGKFLSFLAPKNGVDNIWLRKIGRKLSKAKPITDVQNRGIDSYSWTYKPGFLTFIRDPGRDNIFQLFMVNVFSGKVQAVSEEGCLAVVSAQSYRKPSEIIVKSTERNSNFKLEHYRFNLETLEKFWLPEEKKEEPGKHFIFDWNLEPRIEIRMEENGGKDYLVLNSTGNKWEKARNVPVGDTQRVEPLGFDSSNQKVYWVDYGRRKEFLGLYLKDFDRPQSRGHSVFKVPDSDVSKQDLFFDQNGQFLGGKVQLKKPAIYLKQKADGAYLNVAMHLDVDGGRNFLNIDSFSGDFCTWLVSVRRDDGPSAFYLVKHTVDFLKSTVQFLFWSQKSLNNHTLSKMTVHEVQTRDGLKQICYLTKPPGKAMEVLPMVVLVHGGPWERVFWGYDPEVQFLANRGYAVLQCNFRGSTGYGRTHQFKGYGEYGRGMIEDQVDAVAWIVRKGWADGVRVAIMGRGSGGFHAIAALTFHPHVFSCGISLSGRTSLLSFFRPGEPQALKTFKAEILGADPSTAEGEEYLKAQSPLYHVDQIREPLLMAQGSKDWRVPVNESEEFVEELRKGGGQVTYVPFADEGHDLQKPENRINFYVLCESFLEICLKNGAGKDLEG